jgi:hypothetical protein
MQVQQPFFARYLESQDSRVRHQGSEFVTLRYPSDSDNIDPCHQPHLPGISDDRDHRCRGSSHPVTLKFPSDNEDGGDHCQGPHRHHHSNRGNFLQRLIDQFLRFLGIGGEQPPHHHHRERRN